MYAARMGDLPPYLFARIDEMKAEQQKKGVDIIEALKEHDTTPALWKLNSGVVATPNISLIDLTVALIIGKSAKGRR